jgi:hypothetical protein
LKGSESDDGKVFTETFKKYRKKREKWSVIIPHEPRTSVLRYPTIVLMLRAYEKNPNVHLG